jgi:hypothetical protein
MLPDDVFGLQWLFGCPDELFCALAATSNLACDIESDPLAHTSLGLLPHYEYRASDLHAHISSFTPTLPSRLRGTGTHNAARTAVQELWRQTAYILYYQTIGYAAEHRSMQSALREFRELCRIIELGLPALLYGSLALPLFLAATVAVTPEDRNDLRLRHAGQYSDSTRAFLTDAQPCLKWLGIGTGIGFWRSFGVTALPKASKRTGGRCEQDAN